MDLQKQIGALCPITETKQIAEKWEELETRLHAAQKTYIELRNISQATRQTIAAKIGRYRNSLALLEYDVETKSVNREVAPNLHLDVTEVPNAEAIPDAQIYYIENTQEYAFRLNGNLIAGHIGNIHTRGHKHIRCPKTECKCKLWHQGEPVSFLQSSWVHTDAPPGGATANMRHAGNRDTLAADIKRLPKREINLRHRQLIHDALIYTLLTAN